MANSKPKVVRFAFAADARFVAYRRTTMRLGAAMLMFLALFNGLDLVLYPLFAIFEAMLTDKAMIVAMSIYDMLIYALAFMLPVLFYRLITPKGERIPLPMDTTAPRKLMLLVPAALAVVYCAALANGYLLDMIGLSAPAIAHPEPNPAFATYEAVLLYISVSLIPAFCEEFLFRGLALSHLMPYGKTVAIIGSAVLFGLMHGTGEQILYTTVAGIVLAYVTIESGSIWGGVIIHMFNNLLSVVDEVLFNRLSYRDEMLLYSALELLVIGGGMICLAILLLQRDKKKARETMPSLSADADDGLIAGAPLTGGSVYGFFSPTMIAFFVISIIEIISGMLWYI